MDFKEEYEKYLKEKEELYNGKYVSLSNQDIVELHYYNEQNEKSIDLFTMRLFLKKAILDLGSGKQIQFISKNDEISFLKEYREFIAIKRYLLPKFIFDDFDSYVFKACVDYKYTGHTLLETENHYINNLKNKKTK